MLNQTDACNSDTGFHNNDGADHSRFVWNQSANNAAKTSAKKCDADIHRSSSACRKSAKDEPSRASKTIFRRLMSKIVFFYIFNILVTFCNVFFKFSQRSLARLAKQIV